jgi:hypothetical protein
MSFLFLNASRYILAPPPSTLKTLPTWNQSHRETIDSDTDFSIARLDVYGQGPLETTIELTISKGD